MTTPALPDEKPRVWGRFERSLRAMGLSGKALVIAAPTLWLTLFFLVPLFVVGTIAFSERARAIPPYLPLITVDEDGTVQLTLHLSNFISLLNNSLYIATFFNSVKMAAISTVFALLIGYPMAYFIARSPDRFRNILLMLVILPFWTSFLLRVYAWMGFLAQNGVINNFLGNFGIGPITMLQTDFAVYVGIVYTYLPFMILPLYTNLVKLDQSLLEAAADLGSRPWQTFLSVTLPLSVPGIVAGSALVFIPAIGEFVIPTLLGGPDTLMIGKVLWNEFYSKRNWPMAAAVAIAMLIVIVLPIMIAQRAQSVMTERASR